MLSNYKGNSISISFLKSLFGNNFPIPGSFCACNQTMRRHYNIASNHRLHLTFAFIFKLWLCFKCILWKVHRHIGFKEITQKVIIMGGFCWNLWHMYQGTVFIFRPPTWWASLVVSHSLIDNYVYHLWLRTCLIISRFWMKCHCEQFSVEQIVSLWIHGAITARLNIKAVFTNIVLSIVKIKQSWGRLIFVMGISILVTYFYTDLATSIHE